MSDEPSRPGLDTLADYLEGLLGAEESREVERWVAEDAATAGLVQELQGLPRLLAADPVEPMPRNVVDRVDAALAAAARDAGAHRDAGEPSGAVVVPLRRRRWLAPALAAAAMVGMVGIGAQVLSSVGTGSDGGAESADSAADAPADHSAAGGQTEEARPDKLPEAPADGAGGLPPISTDGFATDVRDALADRPAGLRESAAAAGSRLSILSSTCSVDLAAGQVLPIRLDGGLAVLVLRRIPGEPDRREALAYPARCPDGAAAENVNPLAQAVIRLP